MKRVVFDASALMTLVLGRSGAEKVEELIAAAVEGKRELLMSVVNWAEVYYSIWLAQGRANAEKALQLIAQLPIELVGADAELAKAAAQFKAQHKLPYADCFAAALALKQKAVVATSDADFDKVKEQIPVLVF